MTFTERLQGSVSRLLEPIIKEETEKIRQEVHKKIDEIISKEVANIALSLAKYASVQDLRDRIVIEIRDLREGQNDL